MENNNNNINDTKTRFNFFYKIIPNKSINQFIGFVCLFKRLYKSYMCRYLKQIIFALMLMIVVSVITSCVAYIIGPIINKVFVEKDKQMLYVVCVVLVVLYLIKTSATYIQEVCLKVLCTRVTMDIRVDVFNKIIKMPMKDVDKMQNGQIMTLFLNDITNVGDSSQDLFVVFFRDFITVLFLVFVVFYNDWLLAILGFCIYPLVFVPLSKISKSARSKFAQEQTLLQTITARLTDVINGVKTIKVYNTEKLETNKIKTLLIHYTKTAIAFLKKTALASPSMELGCGLSMVLIVFVGGYRVVGGYCDVGRFFSFFTSLILIHRPARCLAEIKTKLQACFVSLNRVFSFVDGLQTEDLNTGLTPDVNNATIKFDNVNFNYYGNTTENNDTKKTLHDINIEIKPHEKIAFVGFSGSGKSTLANLLLRLYSCDSGVISINGVDINNISLSYLRNNIAYVGQDNFLFDDSIRNNMLYGSQKQITETDIEKAIRFAQINFLSSSICEINEGIGCDGGKLSAGQKQRIAIARAVIKDSPIVIFDEATASLDATTEYEIRNAIFTEMKDKTVIIIAHRLSTIVGCDKIYVMENGNIVESGTHDRLLANGGLYRRFWNNLNDNQDLN